MNRFLSGLTLSFLTAALAGCAGSGPPAHRETAAPPPAGPEAGGKSEELRAEFQAAKAIFNSRDYEGATQAFGEVAAKAEAAGDAELLVAALSLEARGHLIQEHADEGRPYLERAGALTTPETPWGHAEYLGVRGRFEWRAGDNDAARATFEEMYDLCMKDALHGLAVDAAHMVAIVAPPEAQVEWARRGIAAAEAGDMNGWLGPLWNNLGNTYQDLGDNDEALECFLKARHYHWLVGSEHQKLVADWAVGMALRRAGRFDEAAAWLRPVLAWAERRYALDPEGNNGENPEWVGYAKKELAHVAIFRGETDLAREYLQDAKELLEPLGMPDWDPKGWAELNEALAELGPA